MCEHTFYAVWAQATRKDEPAWCGCQDEVCPFLFDTRELAEEFGRTSGFARFAVVEFSGRAPRWGSLIPVKRRRKAGAPKADLGTPEGRAEARRNGQVSVYAQQEAARD